MIWYLEDVLRFRNERRAVDELLGRASWLTPADGWKIGDNARATWEGEITAGGKVWPVALRYPHHFPHSPPLVLPRGDTERWSSHQWGPGGELCLEYGSDNWHADITGADMLESAFRLLEAEQPSTDREAPGVVESRHDFSIGQLLRSDWLYYFSTPEFEEKARFLPEGRLITASAVCWLHAEACIYMASAFTAADGEEWVQPNYPKRLKNEFFERRIAIVRVPPSFKIITTNLTDFRNALASTGVALPDVGFTIFLRGPHIAAYYLNDDQNSVTKCAIIPAQAPENRLDPSHDALAERRTALVGCGSMGSKIAAMLARAGVGEFLLVDDDLLFPDNLVRHDLDWREIGTHKVDSVARRIKLINANAITTVRRHKLGGQEASSGLETLIEEFGKCDLMIDATADPKVFNYLCAAVAAGKKPMIWAEVFGGGVGGLLARHRPGVDPSPASIRRTIESWCADKVLPRERSARGYGDDGSENPLIADDADVSVIAAHAARMAIDLLIPRSPSTFPHSVYMIGLAEGLFFSQPFDTQPIQLDPKDTGLDAEADENVRSEERAFFGQLIKKFVDENSSDE